jgi:hypothetical protein
VRRARLAAVAAVLLAIAVLGRVGAAPPRDRIASRSVLIEPAPAVLADGSPIDVVPGVVARRFTAPVVGGRRLAALPPGARDCLRPWWDGYRSGGLLDTDAAIYDEWDGLVARLSPPTVWLGTEGIAAVATAATGRAPAGWPVRYELECGGRLDGDARKGEAALRFAAAAVGHRSEAEDHPLWTVHTDAPARATWALQERNGWWLAHDVSHARRVAFQVSTAPLPHDGRWEPPPVRVVFLDQAGGVIEDRAIDEDALTPPVAHAPGRLVVGPVAQVRAALDVAPLRRCDGRSRICVWVIADGGDVLALAAAGPFHLDVPPFSDVGWCPSSNMFQGRFSGS